MNEGYTVGGDDDGVELELLAGAVQGEGLVEEQLVDQLADLQGRDQD